MPMPKISAMTKISTKLKLVASDLGVMGVARKFYLNRYYSKLRGMYRSFLETGDIPLPDSLIWEPTGKCNLRCRMCYINFAVTTKSKEMSFEDFKIMVNKVPTLKNITLIGGELFLRRDIFEILEFLQTKGIKTAIATNGTLLSPPMIEKLEKYKEMSSVVVSIDGPEKIHNQIRGWQFAFQQSMKNVKAMRERGIFVSLVSVITKENMPHLKEIIDVAKESKANYIELEYERMYTKEMIEETAKALNIPNTYENFPLVSGDQELPEYSMEKLKLSLDDTEKAATDRGVVIGYMPFYFKEKLSSYYNRTVDGEHFCKQLFIPRVDCEGNVIFCFAIKKPFGNILQQSFEEIWYGKELTDFRKRFLNNPVLPICKTCEKLITYEKEDGIASLREKNFPLPTSSEQATEAADLQKMEPILVGNN